MADDSHWATRLEAFETILQRLTAASEANDTPPTATVESYAEISMTHLGDAHQKVATEALAVLTMCIVKFTAATSNKLGAILTALFQRLADRRAQIRDQANNLLNVSRSAYDPCAVAAALSPRILDIPERMKTALMQYLGVVIPHCGAFFSQPHNTWAFLGRVASVLGCGGSKPSATLTVAGRRVLELVYKTAPHVVLSQIATLPLQQQLLVKKLLESAVPDVDTLVSAAGRAEWNNR
jgi:hypothetical protein